MKKAEKMQLEYDKSAETYNSRYSNLQYSKYQKALSNLELNGKILDLGCGTSLLSKFLNMDLVGVDISMKMLQQGVGDAVQAQAELLPFKDNSFDYVLSFVALMNFENPPTALKEVRRVLKKD